jgi:hypothetical protein
MNTMTIADGSWYSSGTFWAIGGVAATLIIGIAGAWLGWISANPTRRLLYDMPTVTPLLNAGDVTGLKVLRGNVLIEKPQVVEIVLASQGRFDIPTSAFDNKRPLQLDIGATIVEVLKVSTSSGDHGVPVFKTDGTVLKIGPSLIPKHQRISFSLLVDGHDPNLAYRNSPLVDVELLKGPPVTSSAAWARLLLWAVAVPALIIIGAYVRRVQEFSSSTRASEFAPVIEALLVGSAAWAAVALLSSVFVALPKKWRHLGPIFTSKTRKGEIARSSGAVASIGTFFIFIFSPALLPAFPPPLANGALLYQYTVNIPAGFGISLQSVDPVPTSASGDIIFSHGMLASAGMEMAQYNPDWLGAPAIPTARDCNRNFVSTSSNQSSTPHAGEILCASGSSGGIGITASLTVVSLSRSSVDLKVVVWNGMVSTLVPVYTPSGSPVPVYTPSASPVPVVTPVVPVNTGS